MLESFKSFSSVREDGIFPLKTGNDSVFGEVVQDSGVNVDIQVLLLRTREC